MKGTGLARAAALAADDTFRAIKHRLIADTGHFYYADKDDILLERLRRRLSITRDLDLAAYWARLGDPVAGPTEWRALEGEIAVPETYFFRYTDQFDALRRDILPDLIARNRDSRQLRILSAGCSTGPEPYSIAILLAELLGDSIADWRPSIVGVDLSEPALQTARNGAYTRWALRSLSTDQRQAWFDEYDGRWHLKPRYRAMARFARLNLLDLLGPAAPLEISDYDLILCRNVLIYFHPDQVNRVSEALVDRLKPEGWLLVGHAEANPDFNRFAKPVLLDQTVAYQPLAAKDRPPPAAPWRPEPPAEPPPPTVLAPQLPPLVAPPPPREVASSVAMAPPLAEDFIPDIRLLADSGQFAAAERLCEQALALSPQDPGLHFYAGMIQMGLGHADRAEEALRRAVYLEPDFIVAHYNLGLARLAQGKASGRRAVMTAASLAGTIAASTRLTHGAGLTAGDLWDLARLLLGGREPGAAGS